MYLWDLCPGVSAMVERVEQAGQMGRRLMDLGLIPGTCVSCLGQNPGKSLKSFYVRGAVIALREGDGRGVLLMEEGGSSWA